MAIFEEALRRGIDAHGRAAAARREIDSVLAQASREATSVLGASVELRLDVRKRSTREQSIVERAAGVPAPREQYLALIARARAGGSNELAEVELGELGYPVHLRWGNQVGYAEDREGFESAIAEILGSSMTGEKLAEVVGAQPPAPPTESGSDQPASGSSASPPK